MAERDFRAMLRQLPAVAALAAAAGFLPAVSAHASDGELQPHRAVYTLNLAMVRPESPVTAVAGQLVYEFAGNACAGYTSSFRFTADIASTTQGTSATDLHTSSEESADGKQLRFSVLSKTGADTTADFAGVAVVAGDKTRVTLSRPLPRETGFDQPLLFPVAEMRHLLAAAKRGDKILAEATYDGSEPPDQGWRTSSLIGAAVTEPDATAGEAKAALPPAQAAPAAKVPELLAGQTRWPVTVSYFPLGTGDDAPPDHSVSFDLYSNGISSKMRFDYGEFAIEGHLAELAPLPATPCPATPAKAPAAP